MVLYDRGLECDAGASIAHPVRPGAGSSPASKDSVPEAQSGAAWKGCKGKKRKGEVGMRGLHSPGGVLFKMQPSVGHGGGGG